MFVSIINKTGLKLYKCVLKILWVLLISAFTNQFSAKNCALLDSEIGVSYLFDFRVATLPIWD